MSPRAIDLSLLSGVAAVTGIDIGSLGELISNPQSRIATLRLSLAWTILSRCVGQAMPDGSLLPDEVAAFSASVAGTKYTDPSKQNSNYDLI